MQQTPVPNSSGVLPRFACPCLNVKIYPCNLVGTDDPTTGSQISSPPPTTPEWEAVYVDSNGIHIAYEQLTLTSRSPEHGLHVVCHLCNIVVYRLVEGVRAGDTSISTTSDVTSPSGISSSLMSPATRERADFQTLFKKDKENRTWIQVRIKDGCISGNRLEDALSKASAIFGLNIPSVESVSPAPTPPTQTVSLPQSSATPGPTSNVTSTTNTTKTTSTISTTSTTNTTNTTPTVSITYQLNVNWPVFIQPPPFVPSHPLYAKLARVAKKASSKAREDAEASIKAFIHAKQAEIAEYEAGLRSQVNTVWRLSRDSLDKDRQSANTVPASLDFDATDPRAHTRRHPSVSSNNNAIISNVGSSARRPTIIRDFETETTVPPRASDPQLFPSTSFSPSTATPRVHPPMSALGTSLIQSGMHMPRHRAASPQAASTKGETVSIEPSSLTPPGTKDVDPRVSRPKEGAAKRRSLDAKGVAPPNDNDQERSATDMSRRGASTGQQSSTGDTQSKDTGKKKAVTFSEARVASATRRIKPDRSQGSSKKNPKGEEEPLFDLDVDEQGAVPPSTEAKQGKERNYTGNRHISGYEIESERDKELPNVTLSFKNRANQYTMARSLPKPRAGPLASTSLGAEGYLAEGMKTQVPHAFTVQDPSLLASSPSSKTPSELLRLMAGQTPTHRGAWKAGTSSADQSDEDDSEGSDTEQEDEAGAGARARARAMGVSKANERAEGTEEANVVSKSVPMDVPAMRPTVQASKAADNDFEGAMSKSHDPGPALELLVGTHDDDDEDDETLPPVTTESTNGVNGSNTIEDEDKERADLMKRLMEGRGSLHAQKILRQTDRGVPDSMWRSMA